MCRYIDEEDLMRFMIKEEVDLVFPLLEGSDKGQIGREALTDWVVRPLLFSIFLDRKYGTFVTGLFHLSFTEI